MAYDEGLAHLLREDLEGLRITEKKMFGGLAFLLGGHMVCGVTKEGAMYRVGKPNNDAALTIEGVRPMMFTRKLMAGFVASDDDATVDDTRRRALVQMSLSFVKTLPPK